MMSSSVTSVQAAADTCPAEPLPRSQLGRPKMPVAAGDTSVHGLGSSEFVRHLERLINASPKTQRQIAREIGYDKPNIITMFKQGSCRVPVDRVAPLAFALEVDAAELLRLWLAQYVPQMLVAIERHLGLLLSVREREWIEVLRQRFPEGMPPWEQVVVRCA